MSMLDDIGTRISSIVTAAGYTLDKGFLRDDTDKRVCIAEYGGAASQLGFGFSGIYLEEPSLQVKVRGEATDYEGPRAVIQSIYQNLPQVQATTLTSTFYHLIIPKQTPFPLERDSKNRVIWVVNFTVEKRL